MRCGCELEETRMPCFNGGDDLHSSLLCKDCPYGITEPDDAQHDAQYDEGDGGEGALRKQIGCTCEGDGCPACEG